ncbi:MAG: 3-deoxy-D-manno-octulosonic acid transferase [Phycisphaerae bacterium]|jgi:3-deoxy-D-manno-octulosonic-acid transferase
MRWLVDLVYLIVAVLICPVILFRSLTTGKYRQGWGQRRGLMPVMPPANLWPRVWVHAVSMGEMNAVRGLIETWRRQSPDTEFVISTTTDTGQARARELFPDLTVIRYPLDFSRFVRRALDRIAPSLIVLVELEVWYQFLGEARRRGIPVAVVNGRLSARSARRFRWVGPFARRMFSSLAWVGAQDDVYAVRFRQMGVPAERISVTGSLKWDTAQPTEALAGAADALARALGIDPHRPLWVCGSTGPGEEAIVLAAFAGLRERFPALQLAIIPRKPERFDEVADLIRKAGQSCLRRSRCPDGVERPATGTSVVLGDTMGELRKFYSLAAVVFVGRTIAPQGGSDMMEVAALGKPIIVGPHTENFADAVAQLKQHEAIRIIDAELNDPRASEKLADAVAAILGDPAEARRLADHALQVVQRNRGATQRTLSRLLTLIDGPAPAAPPNQATSQGPSRNPDNRPAQSRSRTAGGMDSYQKPETRNQEPESPHVP